MSQADGPARNSDIFVVIPAYNEHEVLGQTVADVASYGYSIVVIDDGSPLPERDCLAGSASANIWYLRHASNLGAGAAVQTGTDFALQQRAEIIVHFDADGQHIPALIDDLVRPIRRGDRRSPDRQRARNGEGGRRSRDQAGEFHARRAGAAD